MLKEAAINHLSDEVKVHKNNPGSLWKIIDKTIPVKEKEKHIYTKTYLDLKSIVEDFNNYFTSVGKITAATALDLANKNNIALSDPMLNSEIYPKDQQFKFKPVTCSVIRRIIMAMPRNKSPGPDKISMGVIYHLFTETEGNSVFCGPETVDVSRGEAEGNIDGRGSTKHTAFPRSQQISVLLYINSQRNNKLKNK